MLRTSRGTGVDHGVRWRRLSLSTRWRVRQTRSNTFTHTYTARHFFFYWRRLLLSMFGITLFAPPPKCSPAPLSSFHTRPRSLLFALGAITSSEVGVAMCQVDKNHSLSEVFKQHSLWNGAGGGALSTPPSYNRHSLRSLPEKRGVGRLIPTFMVSIRTWRPWTCFHKLLLSVLTCQLQLRHCKQINCCRKPSCSLNSTKYYMALFSFSY